MADNVNITPGTGEVIAADEISGAKWQRVKVGIGADGTATDWTGVVGTSDIVVTVTPTLDTSAYAAGDLLFDSTEVANAVRANGDTCILQSVTVLDKADQKMAFTLLFADAATDFGTLNNAPDPDDTEAATVLGFVKIATDYYVDLGASSVACLTNIGLELQAGGSTTSLYLAAINGAGAPTYAASDLVIKLGFLRS